LLEVVVACFLLVRRRRKRGPCMSAIASAVAGLVVALQCADSTRIEADQGLWVAGDMSIVGDGRLVGVWRLDEPARWCLRAGASAWVSLLHCLVNDLRL
jgi:hypothetical protein